MKLVWKSGKFTDVGNCYYQTAATEDGRSWTISKAIVGGEPSYQLWRGNELVRGMLFTDAGTAKRKAQEIEDGQVQSTRV